MFKSCEVKLQANEIVFLQFLLSERVVKNNLTTQQLLLNSKKLSDDEIQKYFEVAKHEAALMKHLTAKLEAALKADEVTIHENNFETMDEYRERIRLASSKAGETKL